jgi:hypothetical protein
MPVFDIDKLAEEGEFAEKIPPGQGVDLRIAKAKDHGKPSKNGDRQLRVVFEDMECREAMTIYQVEGKAVWRLAVLLKSLGYSSNDMKEAGLTPVMLLNSDAAEYWLKGKTLKADVAYDTKGYSDIKPLLPKAPEPEYADAPASDKLAPGSTYGKPAPVEDEIPF